MNGHVDDVTTDQTRTPHPAPDGVARVPDLIGLSVADACQTAARAGTSFSLVRVEQQRGPWDVVVAQSPSPGIRLQASWRVHVLVAVAPRQDAGPRSTAPYGPFRTTPRARS